MTNYYYEWEGDTVYRSEKVLFSAKSKGKNEVKVSFEHPDLLRHTCTVIKYLTTI